MSQVTDLFGTTTTVKTRKVSCQYPIMAIQDMSSAHPSNQQNNSWTVTTEFPTDEEIVKKTKDKIYEASLWARENEEIVFSAKFGRGSHMNITWSLDPEPHDEDNTYNDDCKTTEGDEPAFDPAIAFQGEADIWCQFPFRYNDTLFYGCSNFTLDGDATNVCATEIDEDYNAIKVGLCNDHCHTQGKL